MNRSSLNAAFFHYRMTRRQLLLHGGAIGMLALTSPLEVLGNVSAGSNPLDNGFIAVSQRLTESVDLMPALSERLYRALKAQYPKFDIALTQLIQECAKAEASGLTSQLSASATVTAKRIVSAWYTGKVGKGGEEKVILYRHGLGFNAVDDVLGVRSYCPDNLGSWALKPKDQGSHDDSKKS